MKRLTVGELVEQLSEYDKDLPVEFLTYGCGHSSHLPFTDGLLSLVDHDRTGELVVQIQADWN